MYHGRSDEQTNCESNQTVQTRASQCVENNGNVVKERISCVGKIAYRKDVSHLSRSSTKGGEERMEGDQVRWDEDLLRYFSTSTLWLQLR